MPEPDKFFSCLSDGIVEHFQRGKKQLTSLPEVTKMFAQCDPSYLAVMQSMTDFVDGFPCNPHALFPFSPVQSDHYPQTISGTLVAIYPFSRNMSPFELSTKISYYKFIGR